LAGTEEGGVKPPRDIADQEYVEELEAERDALKAALERVESILRPIATDNPVYERTTAHFDAYGIARQALEEVEK